MSKKHLTFIDMFAGIGGFHSGMEQAGHKCVGWIEWNKFARQSYEALYDTEDIYNARDIRTVKGTDLPSADVWCFGFPCQDVSVAGKQAGVRKGTRSGLFFEVIRLLEERAEHQETLPAYLVVENVKNLLSIDGGWGFARVQIEMDKAGYDVEWNVFNSAEVVPQNRERVYIIGHLRTVRTRKVLPIQRQSSTTAKESKVNKICHYGKSRHQSNTVIESNGVSQTLSATDYKHPQNVRVKQIGNVSTSKSFNGNPQVGRVYSSDGLSPTLNTMQGGGREPKVVVKRPLKGKTNNGWHFEQEVFSKNGITATLKAGGGSGNIPKVLVKPCLAPDRLNKRQDGRRFKEDIDSEFTLTGQDRHGVLLDDGTSIAIRKLTPLECWRLQGFTDEQFYKAKNAGVSDSQLYKQAGNAVTVPVVKAIAERLSING